MAAMSQGFPIAPSVRLSGPYTAGAGQTLFSVTFPFQRSGDLLVQTRATASAPWATMTEGTHYTVAGAGASAGGAITFLVGRTGGTFVRILGLAPIGAEVDAVPAGGFRHDVFNTALDRITIWAQEARRDIGDLIEDLATQAATVGQHTAQIAALLILAGDPLSGAIPSFDITWAEIPTRAILVRRFQVAGLASVGDPGAGAVMTLGTADGPMAKQDAAGTWWQLDCGDTADLGYFGWVNDPDVPDDAALDRAYAYLMDRPSGGTILFRAGKYRFNEEHNIHPHVPLALHFDRGAKVYCGLGGADKVMWKATHPDGSTRGRSLVLSGQSDLEFHSSVTGVGGLFFEYLNASDFKVQDNGHNWVHYRNNTAIRLSGTWNCDGDPLTVWGGGHRKPRRDTGSVTFSISAASTSLLASAPIFAAGDVGDTLVVGDEAFTISAVTDTTHATVTSAATQTLTAQRGSFGGVRATAVNGNTTVTLDAAVAVASDVGRVVYIADASSMFGAGTPKRAHRATIVSVPDSTHIVLDAAPTLDAAGAEIVFSPAIEIFGDAALGNEVNDIKWYGLHLEEIYGTGLMVKGGGNISFPQLKLHANNYGTNATATDYLAWFDDALAITGDTDYEGTTVGRLGRILVSGLIGTLIIGDTLGLAVRRQPLVHARNMGNAGVVAIGNWYVANQVDDATFAEAFKLVGGGRFIQTGRVTGYNRAPSVYPQVSGPRPPAGFLPSSTEKVLSLSASLRHTLLSTGTPIYAGVGVGSAIEAPAPTAEYAVGVQLAGGALAPTGTTPVDIAQITAVARSPSGGVIAGQWELATRNAAGTLATRWVVSAAGGYLPADDNAYDLGWSGGRIKDIYAANATINTSDATLKQDISPVPSAWLDAWGDVQWQRFRWIDAVETKGDAARWHVGLIAQQIRDAFAARALDARAIGLLCYDEWPEEPGRPEIPAQLDEDGREVTPAIPAVPARPAGARWGVRYTECLAMEAAYVRRAITGA